MYVATVAMCMGSLCSTAWGATTLIEPRTGVDMPTAGILHRGQFAIGTQMFRGGGLNLAISVGVLDRLMFGISFGGTGIIGVGDVTWQKTPGIMIKYRVIEESVLPAFVLGFDSQGNEGYNPDARRYTIKSPGFYIAASKNYALLGSLAVHGCVNYSLENSDSKIPDLQISADKSAGEDVSILAEYDFALNDHNVTPRFGKGRGYFNMGVRWMVGGGLSLEADVKNLFGNQDGVPAGSRVIRMEYVQHL